MHAPTHANTHHHLFLRKERERDANTHHHCFSITDLLLLFSPPLPLSSSSPGLFDQLDKDMDGVISLRALVDALAMYGLSPQQTKAMALGLEEGDEERLESWGGDGEAGSDSDTDLSEIPVTLADWKEKFASSVRLKEAALSVMTIYTAPDGHNSGNKYCLSLEQVYVCTCMCVCVCVCVCV